MLLRILLLFTFIYVCSKASCQSSTYSDHIGSEDGLISQLCQNLVEDKYGNLWISSFVGVQKYDGHKATSFPLHDLRDKELHIVDLIADQNGMVWILQGENTNSHYSNHIHTDFSYKISIINPLTDEIMPFSEYVDASAFSENKVRLIQSIGDKIYLITEQKSIYTFTTQLEKHSDNPDFSEHIRVNREGNIVRYSENRITNTDRTGKVLFSIDSSYIAKYPAYYISENGNIFFVERRADKINILEHTGDEIAKLISIEPDEFFKFLILTNLKHSVITKLPGDKLLINESYYASPDSSALTLKNSISELPIYDYARSKSGLDFIATNLGVYVLKDKQTEFKSLATSPEKNSVRAFFSNSDLRLYKEVTSEVIEQNSSRYDLTFIENNFLGYMASMHYQDPLDSNVIWSCGYLSQVQLRKINFENQKIQSFIDPIARAINMNHIHRSSKSQKLYLATNDGLLYLDEHNNTNETFLTIPNTEGIEATHIVERDEKLWIASTTGVIIYDESSNNHYIDPIFDSIDYTIQFIHQDLTDNNIVWLGTRQGGIIKWDTNKNTYETYNKESGLSNNDAHAIIEDSNERLWIPTNKNLNCLDKKTGHISIFTEQDGITDSEFNKYGYFFDRTNNLIYFGGLNGYTYFNPDNIKTDELDNNIEIRIVDANKIKEDLTVQNINIEVNTTGSIDFYEEDISLQLLLATNHLYHTSKTNYSYRIPGLYDDWITQPTNILNINRIPYGEYTIELVSDLNKPSYTSNTLALDILVKKPFSKTWLAFILKLLLFLLLTWLAVQWYLRGIKERNAKLEKVVSERTQELRELNQTKSKLFAILAHDLRNPIGSLNDITEKIKFLSRHNRLAEIDILAEQTKDKISALDESLNNILIWALSENKKLVQRPEKLSLKLEINKILNLYSTQISKKNLATCDNLDVVDQVYLDVNILQTILRNVISNALKFSPPDGKISCLKSYEDADRIQLTISDEGIGMQNDSPHLDEIQKTELHNEGKGSGIGLKIIYELAEISGVDITVRSNHTGGTDFMLDMPRR